MFFKYNRQKQNTILTLSDERWQITDKIITNQSFNLVCCWYFNRSFSTQLFCFYRMSHFSSTFNRVITESVVCLKVSRSLALKTLVRKHAISLEMCGHMASLKWYNSTWWGKFVFTENCASSLLSLFNNSLHDISVIVLSCLWDFWLNIMLHIMYKWGKLILYQKVNFHQRYKYPVCNTPGLNQGTRPVCNFCREKLKSSSKFLAAVCLSVWIWGVWCMWRSAWVQIRAKLNCWLLSEVEKNCRPNQILLQ